MQVVQQVVMHGGLIWLWQLLLQTSPALAVPTPHSPPNKLPGALHTRLLPLSFDASLLLVLVAKRQRQLLDCIVPFFSSLHQAFRYPLLMLLPMLLRLRLLLLASHLHCSYWHLVLVPFDICGCYP